MSSPPRYVTPPPNIDSGPDKPVKDHEPEGVTEAQSTKSPLPRPKFHFICRPDFRLDDDTDFIVDEFQSTVEELAKEGVKAIDFADRPDNRKPRGVCRCPEQRRRRMEYNIVLKHHGRKPMQIHVPQVRVGVGYTGPISWPNSPAPTRPTSPAGVRTAGPSNPSAQALVPADSLNRPPLLSDVIAALAEAARVQREQTIAAYISAASQKTAPVSLGSEDPPKPIPSSSTASGTSTLKRKRNEESLGCDIPKAEDPHCELSMEGIKEESTQPKKRARKCEVVETTRVTRSQTARVKAAAQPIAARLRPRSAKSDGSSLRKPQPKKSVVTKTKLQLTERKLRARMSDAVALSIHSKTSKKVARMNSASTPSSKAKATASGKRGRK